MTINETLIACVGEFMNAMEQYLPGPYVGFVEEEARETLTAYHKLRSCSDAAEAPQLLADVIKEVVDFYYVQFGFMMRQDRAEMLDEPMVDEAGLLKVHGFSIAVQPVLEFLDIVLSEEDAVEAILLVHRSNMTKLGDDSKPVHNEDGKIIKGPNYQPCDLLPIAKRALEGVLLQ